MSERIVQFEASTILPPVVEDALSISIVESDVHYEIRSLLPGVDAEDVIVGVADDVLTIGAKAWVETQHTVGRFFSVDHRIALVEQSFALPPDADARNLTTAFRDGVLSVFLSRTSVSNVVPLFSR